MAPVDFYYMPESPPCRIVEMVANMAGVTLKKHLINLFTREHLSEDYIKLNPLHKVPFIVDGALKLNESRAIAAYLVTRYMPDDNTLYPKDPVKRAKVDELLYLDVGSLWQTTSNLLRPRLFGPVKTLDETAEKALSDVLGYFDNRLKANSNKKFLLGDDLTIGDISISATLSFIEANEYDISKFESLSAYYDRLKSSIPKYEEINGEPMENMRKFIKSKQEV